MPLVGGQVGLQLTRNLGFQLTLFLPGGQILPTALLLAHPELKTQRHLCNLFDRRFRIPIRIPIRIQKTAGFSNLSTYIHMQIPLIQSRLPIFKIIKVLQTDKKHDLRCSILVLVTLINMNSGTTKESNVGWHCGKRQPTLASLVNTRIFSGFF